MSDTVNGIRLTRDPGGNLPVVVQVWAEFALFTRPELKAERVSYPVMTPTAAVGVLEAIYWKPEFRYRIEAIEVIEWPDPTDERRRAGPPGRQFSIRRNETSDLPTLAKAVRAGRRVDTAAHRDQRNAVCLRDVAYRIHAHIVPQPHADKPISAYRDQLRRRVNRGACFQRPYLGTREFSAEFGPADETPRRTDHTEKIGIMLHSIHRDQQGEPSMEWFAAEVTDGVLYIPERGLALDLPAQAH